MSPGGEPPLVLLPGIEGVPGVYDELVAALPEVRCLPLSLPLVGCDRTPAAPPTIATLASAVLDRVAPEVFDLFGASIGGLVAWRMATLAPERVRSLCTLGSLPSPTHRPVFLGALAALLRRTPTPMLRGSWRRHLRGVLLAEGVGAERAAELVGALPGARCWPARLRAVATWSPPGPPPVPTLWLRGAAEREAPWTLDDVRRCLPGVRVGVVPGGHRAMITHPAGVAAAWRGHRRSLVDGAG